MYNVGVVITSGIFTLPVETESVTVLFGATVVNAGGFWSITWPAGSELSTFFRLGISPALFTALDASLHCCPSTDGTCLTLGV